MTPSRVNGSLSQAFNCVSLTLLLSSSFVLPIFLAPPAPSLLDVALADPVFTSPCCTHSFCPGIHHISESVTGVTPGHDMMFTLPEIRLGPGSIV